MGRVEDEANYFCRELKPCATFREIVNAQLLFADGIRMNFRVEEKSKFVSEKLEIRSKIVFHVVFCFY